MSNTAIDLQPFPAIPLELKAEILSHCDAGTLAKASSASLAFLQLASPLLTDTSPSSDRRDSRSSSLSGSVRNSHVSAFALFCLSKEPPSAWPNAELTSPFLPTSHAPTQADVQVPALAPYLDLSLVQSITYIDVEEQSFVPGIVCPDEDDLKVVHPDHKAHVFAPLRLIPLGATGPTFTPLVLSKLHAMFIWGNNSQLFAFFNPVVVRIEGGLHPSLDTGEMEVLGFFDQGLFRAPRLRELVLVDAVSQDPLYFPAKVNGRSWTLRYELSVETESAQSVLWIVDDLSVDSHEVQSLDLERVVIQVRTEGIQTTFLDRLANSLILDRTTVVVKPAPAIAAAAPSAVPT